MCHASTYVTARDEFDQAFPRVSTASDNAGLEGLGTRLDLAQYGGKTEAKELDPCIKSI